MTGAADGLPGLRDWEQASAVLREGAVGSDGLLEEEHNDPDQALSDGPQSLFPDQFDELMAQVR